ncbi:hypothetical protein VDGE_20064 [Verticillium dahliae]|uniref:Reverse transcriptase domain-containing protein n=1 Tax=Verticillium dahliae TaxID=27337 RepID=A0A444RIY7_VERDA|nr:hypothetical protein VDGE_20064 [Verticillium dahliae]
MMRNLKVFQVNVDKTKACQEAALHFAFEQGFHIVAVQEPWCSLGSPMNKNTATNPEYKCFSPVSEWTGLDTRPRVLIYVRTGLPPAASFTISDQPCRDTIGVRVLGVNIVNIYRDYQLPTIINTITSWIPPPNTVITGDFNAHHVSWQPGIRSNQSATDIVAWINRHELMVLNRPGMPTHELGNVLDLAITNIPFAKTQIADHCYTGSDHYTLVTTIPLGPHVGQEDANHPRPKLSPADYDRFAELVADTAWLLPTNMSSHAKIDEAADALDTVLQAALDAAGTVNTKNKRARWWTQDCAASARDLHQARRHDPISMATKEAKTAFRKTVRAAKAAFWQNQIEGMKTDRDLYKIMGWDVPRSQFQSPPLRDDNTTITAPAEKADFLRRKLLERNSANEDIDPNTPTCPRRVIPWTRELGPEEVRAAVISVSNTSPGGDSITVKMFQAVWPSTKDCIHRLFQACLDQGYHPRRYRHADTVMIPKPNRDASSHKGWRPISLLLTIGKGIERLIARRMAWLCISEQVLNPQVAGALPKRSSNDIVGCLTHDVEAAMNRNQVATLVTFDIEGAFDAALKGRLSVRLREQGWPENLISWVLSFMSDRQARVRHEGHASPAAPLQCGLPQGSPASPILFLLYTEPGHRIGPEAGRFGYADDCAILCMGKTLKDTTARAQKLLNDTVNWGATNAIKFDPNKTEVMHFTKSRTPTTAHTITHDTKVIEPASAMRWLGPRRDPLPTT